MCGSRDHVSELRDDGVSELVLLASVKCRSTEMLAFVAEGGRAMKVCKHKRFDQPSIRKVKGCGRCIRRWIRWQRRPGRRQEPCRGRI